VLNRRLPRNYRTRRFVYRFRSKMIHPRDSLTNLTRADTFPGAACLTRFLVRQGAQLKICEGVWHVPKRLPSRRVTASSIMLSLDSSVFSGRRKAIGDDAMHPAEKDNTTLIQGQRQNSTQPINSGRIWVGSSSTYVCHRRA
jgi:hypothetical protein